ncbi:hypothetical protein FE257_007753 [Aspergillus nanangensis]|uniref:Zn(2)-C6 fungal-type domain-containing protein n=1 Tax=Aspergillus nanangensis TaxID=2582783 RepID=A0AAD4GYT3_ASPNN|nr:hypothetical protein FE257_007753 [Aspergillus nanangensis]
MAGNSRDSRDSLKKRRNRVPVSCVSCRTLKTKCDGVRPTCATCARHERTCVFDQPTSGARGGQKAVLVNQDYLRSLERRLEILETNSTATATATTTTTTTNISNSPDYIAVTSPSAVAVDANVSIGGVSFPQLIVTALHGRETVEAQSVTTDRDVTAKQTSIADDDLYSLPDDASDLLARFFTFRHALGPLFHVPSIQPMLESALRCPHPRHRPAFILLNMIFALCTSHWSVGNTTAARRHYEIAMALLQPTLLRDWAIEHVQALVLATRYLQGSNCSDECWNVLGLAGRIAYGLRLHQEPPETDPPPVRETKRRVWYAIYTLDMHLSMIYERPSTTRSTEFTVRVPEDLDDDCIRPDGLLYPMPKRPSSSTSFFLEVIKLYRIVEETLFRLARDREEDTGGGNRNTISEKTVVALDHEYQKWHAALPAHLVLDYRDVHEQPWILALRANMVRILIHRQSLVARLHSLVVPQQMENAIASHTLQQSRSICVSAAMETVEIVALRHEQTKQTMGLDWFNVYYLFNAVIVLVSHIVDPAFSDDIPAISGVDKALHMIQAMSKNHSFAQRACTFLHQLLSYMGQAMEATPPVAIPPVSQETDAAASSLDALFGFTQGLTDDLDMRLQTLDEGDLSGSVWSGADGNNNPFYGFAV